MAENDRGLDAFFDASRCDVAQMPADLGERMLADAFAVQAGISGHAVRRPFAANGFWTQLSEALGGWYGIGGLAAACATGVWLGFAPPQGIPDLVGLLVQSETATDIFESQSLTLALSEDG